MSDLDTARRLLNQAEAAQRSTYGGLNMELWLKLSAGWVAIANASAREETP